MNRFYLDLQLLHLQLLALQLVLRFCTLLYLFLVEYLQSVNQQSRPVAKVMYWYKGYGVRQYISELELGPDCLHLGINNGPSPVKGTNGMPQSR